MQQLIGSVERAVREQNWYAALAVALTLPDICGSLERPKSTGRERYGAFYTRYLREHYVYEGPLPSDIGDGPPAKRPEFLTGNDLYALRCSFLHLGSDDITAQYAREVLDRFEFRVGGNHGNRISKCKGVPETLTLDVSTFCGQIVDGAQRWLNEMQGKVEVLARIAVTVRITEGPLDLRTLGR